MELTENSNLGIPTDALRASIPKFLIGQNEIADVLGLTSNAISMAAKTQNLKSFKIGNRAHFPHSAVRHIFSSRGYVYPNQVFSFQMLKGGSTKTSSAFNLAVRLNQYGARVLCLDLDMQGNLTDALGCDGSGGVFFHLLEGERTIKELVVNVGEGIDLIPSNFDNSMLDFLITTKRIAFKEFLQDSLAPIRDNYDFVIIDCNPSLSSLNLAVAFGSDQVIIPVNPDKFSSQGLDRMVGELNRFGVEHKHLINYKLLYTLYDAREGSSQKYLIHYGKQYADKLFNTMVRRNADVKNAIDQKRSIFDFAKAPAREDFDLLAREVLGLQKMERGNA